MREVHSAQLVEELARTSRGKSAWKMADVLSEKRELENGLL